MDALAVALKAVLYGALLSCAGAMLAAASLRVSAVRIIGERVARRAGAVLLFACAAYTLVLLLRLGAPLDAPTLAAIFSSGTGAALFLQVIGTVLVLTAPASMPIRASYAALLPLSLAFSGHAASAGLFESLLLLTHALGLAWWVGTLWLLRSAAVDERARRDVLVCFTQLATRIVVATLVVAAVLTYEFVWPNPKLGAYERNLLIKLSLVATVFALVAYNRFHLTPRIQAGDARAMALLRRSVDVELTLIALVLIATAALTTYTSPHELEGEL